MSQHVKCTEMYFDFTVSDNEIIISCRCFASRVW